MRTESINFYSAYKGYNVNFSARCANYGTPAVLSEHLQEKLAEMRKNYFNIRSFFEQFKNKNSPLSSRIKKGYTDLIPKRQEALTFKYNNKSTITVMFSRKKPRYTWINIDDGWSFNGIVIDNDKLVANYPKNNPHMLPQKIQYMNSGMMQAANPEKFIEAASLKVEQYNRYITKFQRGELHFPPQNKNVQTEIAPRFLPSLQRAQREAITGIKEPEPDVSVNPYNAYWKFFTEEFQNQINSKLKNFRDIIK